MRKVTAKCIKTCTARTVENAAPRAYVPGEVAVFHSESLVPPWFEITHREAPAPVPVDSVPEKAAEAFVQSVKAKRAPRAENPFK